MAKVYTTNTGSKYKSQQIAWDKLLLNYGIFPGLDNPRGKDNLDPDAMVPQLLAQGRVVDPLTVEPVPHMPGFYVVDRGNRRAFGVQTIMKGAFTPEQKAGFEKIDCQVYTDLTPQEREDLIFDHGGVKPLSREETAIACLRLMRQGYSTSQIGERMYSQLARFTGNEKKINEIPVNDPVARQKFLDKWFRGTLDQYILYAGQMGPWMQEQFLLTLKKEDGRHDAAKHGPIILRFDRQNMKELWAARKADKENPGWEPYRGFTSEEKETPDGIELSYTHHGGGPKFNECVEKWVAITKGAAVKPSKPKQPTIDAIEKMEGAYQSPMTLATLKYARGVEGAATEMDRLDTYYTRVQNVMDVLTKHAANLKNGNVKTLVNTILGDGPTAEVEEALKPFLTK